MQFLKDTLMIIIYVLYVCLIFIGGLGIPLAICAISFWLIPAAFIVFFIFLRAMTALGEVLNRLAEYFEE